MSEDPHSGAIAYSYTRSSAKDQLTSQAVAIKKIMKPFSTPVLSKRTYRELKLLKHLRHENVSSPDKAYNKGKF
jgi:p38 MAP kinase